jgi:hypothetical protein
MMVLKSEGYYAKVNAPCFRHIHWQSKRMVQLSLDLKSYLIFGAGTMLVSLLFHMAVKVIIEGLLEVLLHKVGGL